MGFGLVIGFTEHLHTVTTSNYSVTLIHILSSSLQYVLSFLSLLCLLQSLSGNGFQHCRSLNLLAGDCLTTKL